MTTDPRVVAAELRPEYPGRRSASALADPIIEPDWAGLRVVAAVEGSTAGFYRYGDRIDVPAPLEQALAEAFLAVDGVVEGHLTKQAFDTGVGVYPVHQSVPRTMFSLPRLGRRDKRDPYLVGRQHQADEEARAQPLLEALAGGEDHAFVATDLLWLDGQSLLGLPLAERKRQLEAVLAQSRLVRVTPFARPAGSRMAGTWAALGFRHIFWRAANSRYTPGLENPDWVVVAAPQASSRVMGRGEEGGDAAPDD